jgi:integrase
MDEYEAAKNQLPPTTRGIPSGTWRWLCVRYFAECTEFLQLDQRTRRVRRQILENTFHEPIAPGSQKLFRDFPLHKMGREAIEVLRDRKLRFPEAANARLKAMRGVFRWAKRKTGQDGSPLIHNDPTRDISRLKSNNPNGYHAWTDEEVHQFRHRHAVGTKARLALELLLFTGQRRSDVVRFGLQHVKDGCLEFTQIKGQRRNPKRLTLPILPDLQEIIDTSPCGDLTFLVNDYGRPFSAAGFGNWFRDRCVEAGVPGRAHGLRKAGAITAAENGATEEQLKAIFGWSTLRMVELYTRAANQKRLAKSAMHTLGPKEQIGTKASPTK